MTREEFMELNPCIAKVISGEKISTADIVKQSEFFQTHTFAFNFLNEEWLDILQLRYGLIDGTIHTCEQVGQKYGKTRAWINNIERRALKELAKNEHIDMLMRYSDDTVSHSFIKHLIKTKNFKNLMFHDVQNAIKADQLFTKEPMSIYHLRTSKNPSGNYVKTKQKLESGGIKTIDQLFDYLYKNEDLTQLGISSQTYRPIIYAIMRLINDGKVDIKSMEIKQSYEDNKIKYLQYLEDRQMFDGVIFPEHENPKFVKQYDSVLDSWEFNIADKLSGNMGATKCKQVMQNKISAIQQAQSVFGPDLYAVPIEELKLSFMVNNTFRRAGIDTIGQMIEYYYQDETFSTIKQMGTTSERQALDKLAAKGIKLAGDELNTDIKI